MLQCMSQTVARTYRLRHRSDSDRFWGLTDSQPDHCYGLKSLLGQSSQKRCRTRSHSIAELLRSGPIS